MSKSSKIEAQPNDSRPSHEQNAFFRPSSARDHKLPPWLDHFNGKDIKSLVKSALAVWIYSLLIWINATQIAFGQATFFGAIMLFIAPPSGPVFMTALAGVTVIIGVCLGWAWGVITMKAALATRSASDLQAKYAQLQQSATTTNSRQASGQTSFAQIAVFEGLFLDTRVSVTYFCMLGLFVYLMARLRARTPKLALVSIFSIVIADIFLTIAPLIPTFTGTIPQTLIKPAAAAIGIGVVCNLVFFPRSSSHISLDSMQDILTQMPHFLEACVLVLEQPAQEMVPQRLRSAQDAVIGTFQSLEGPLGFVGLELSMGRFSAMDVISLRNPIRRLVLAFLGLVQLQIRRQQQAYRLDKLKEHNKYQSEAKDDQVPDAGHHHVATVYEVWQQFEHPHRRDLTERTLRAIAPTYGSMMKACCDGIEAIRDALRDCNTRRWLNRLSPAECETRRKDHALVLQQLRSQRDDLVRVSSEQMLAQISSSADSQDALAGENAGQKPGPPLASALAVSLLFQERILDMSNAVEAFLDRVVDLETQRTKSRLWPPPNLRGLLSWAVKKDSTDANNKNTETNPVYHSEKDPDDSSDSHAPRTAKQQLAAMQAHGGRQRSRPGSFKIAATRWLSSSEAMYGLRVLVVTVALGVLAVTNKTAGFFYREKGLWALIMAQTGLNVYLGEFVQSFMVRVLGTVAGAVVGVAAWYIGAGSGPGNPYGMAAIMAPIIIILMWMRLFPPPITLQGVIIGAATCYLVVGYSWADTHIPSYGNPGVGYSVFWRRLLLVLIGFGVAALVTLFPRPPSASRHQRSLLAEAIASTKDRYALLVASIDRIQEELETVVEGKAIEVGQILMELEPQISFSKLEFSTSSIDARTLQMVCHLCQSLNQAVTQMLMHVPKLPSHLRDRFLRVTGLKEERIFADVMASLTISRQALKLGEPLPMILPVLARSYADHATSLQPGEVEASNITKELLAEEGSRKYCASMAAFAQFVGAIDDLAIVIKRAVGETSDAHKSKSAV